MQHLRHYHNESLCQKWCVEQCHIARQEIERLLDPMEPPSVAGKCPLNCDICLYSERHKRDDANWIPQPTDKQFQHWLIR